MEDSKVAVITGASRGIGRALAVGFAADDYRIVALARSAEQLASIASEAGVSPHQVLPIAVDLANPEAASQAVRDAVSTVGRIDVLVNNAGIGMAGTLEPAVTDLQAMLAVNLLGPFSILREVVPIMEKAGTGTIINVASRVGKIGLPHTGAYGATKFGLVGLNESLYRLLCPKGIRVTALCPSWVDTKMAKDGNCPLPPSEMIQPADIMKTVRWLLSLSPAACVQEVLIQCRNDIR